MPASRPAPTPQAQRHGLSWRLVVWASALMALIAVSFAAVALASGSASTVSSASNSKIGEEIVVDSHGRTLYYLHPETKHHLLCTSKECLKFWRPLTVSSAKSKLHLGAGVEGRLGTAHRHGGITQVTLRGLLLYRFTGDHGKGEANGENIHSFKGVWHVLPASTSSANPPSGGTEPSSSTSTTSSETTNSIYSYTTSSTSSPTTTSTTTTTTSYTYSY